MEKKAFDSDDTALATILASLGGTGYYVSRHPHLKEFNPFAQKNVTVVGGIQPWDKDVYKTRQEAAHILRESQHGVHFDESVLDKARKAFMMDSFSGQSLGAADALHEGGLNVNLIQRAANSPRKNIGTPGEYFDLNEFYKPFDLHPEQLAKADAVLQVGDSMSDYAFGVARKRGTGIYRLLSDYGDGNFKQPSMWLDGQNWMKVRDPSAYDRLFVPGGAEKDLWQELGRGRKDNVAVGDIAVSPIFKDMLFERHAGPAPKAMLTIGGGAGASMAFRNVGAPETERYDFIGRHRTLFDDILTALRRKHGNDASLDVYLGSTISKPRRVMRDGKMVFERPPSDVSLSRNMQKLVDLMDPSSHRYQQYMRTERGRRIISDLATRYKGLKFYGVVPQSTLGEAYRTSDYVFAMPGSTTAEFSAIQGNKHGGLIHLIPSEEAWSPRHFRGNALYVNRMMQPGAKNNIVSIVENGRLQKLIDAVSEGGFKDWGRRARLSRNPLEGMVNAIKKDIALKRLGRVGKLGLLAAPAVGAGAYIYNKNKDVSLWDRVKAKLHLS